MNIFDKVLEEAFKFQPSESEEQRYEAGNREVEKKVADYVKYGSQGDLNLSYIAFSVVPDTLKVVNGKFSLLYTKVSKLPDNLTVNGSFLLQESPITQLPDNLTVIDVLHLSFLKLDKIESIPNNIKARAVNLFFCPLANKLLGIYKQSGSKEKIKSLYPGIGLLSIYNSKTDSMVLF